MAGKNRSKLSETTNISQLTGCIGAELTGFELDRLDKFDAALRSGGRGLPASGGLSGLLAKERGHQHNYNKPQLTETTVIAWMIEHYQSNDQKSWPKATDGVIEDHPTEKWSNINASLHGGNRGLPGGSSLVKLRKKAERRLDR